MPKPDLSFPIPGKKHISTADGTPVWKEQESSFWNRDIMKFFFPPEGDNRNTEGDTKMFGENHAHIFMNALDYRQAVKDHEKAPDEKLIREHLKAYQEKMCLL